MKITIDLSIKKKPKLSATFKFSGTKEHKRAHLTEKRKNELLAFEATLFGEITHGIERALKIHGKKYTKDVTMDLVREKRIKLVHPTKHPLTRS